MRRATSHLIDLVEEETGSQPENVTRPTDAKLTFLHPPKRASRRRGHKAVVMLGRLAREHGVPLRHSHVRVNKRAAVMAGR